MSDRELLLGATYALSLAAAALALPATLLLLWLYRRSILRLMSQRGPDEDVRTPVAGSHVRRSSAANGPGFADMDATVRRNVAVVMIVALVSALAYALLFLVANDIELSVLRLFTFVVLYTWPGIIGIWIVTAGSRRWVLTSTGVYLTTLLAPGLIRGPGLGATLSLWLWAWLPTAAVLAFLARPFRGVGPMVLGTTMAGIVGAQILTATVVGSESLRELWVELCFAVGITDAVAMFWGLHLACFSGACLLAMPAARLLAVWYSRGGFSDQMLLLGSVFFVFAIDHSLGVGPTNAATFALGMGVFVVAGGMSLLVYRWMHPATSRSTNLLLLRVFAASRSHQGLLDRVSGRWRSVGAVRLISAPDLAVATVEPDEFLAFVAGRLRRLFIHTTSALEARLAVLRPRRDPDGRFRVDEFFCFDNTWRQTVAELLGGSDAVLMDLRGLSAGNAGALTEIRMLVASAAMARTVLVVDDSTDRSVLDAELSGLSGGMTPAIVEVAGEAGADEVVEACLQAASRAG